MNNKLNRLTKESRLMLKEREQKKLKVKNLLKNINPRLQETTYRMLNNTSLDLWEDFRE